MYGDVHKVLNMYTCIKTTKLSREKAITIYWVGKLSVLLNKNKSGFQLIGISREIFHDLLKS